MTLFLLQFAKFLLEHAELIDAIREAVDAGRTKAEILADIRKGMVAASDAAVEQLLGPRPK